MIDQHPSSDALAHDALAHDAIARDSLGADAFDGAALERALAAHPALRAAVLEFAASPDRAPGPLLAAVAALPPLPLGAARAGGRGAGEPAHPADPADPAEPAPGAADRAGQAAGTLAVWQLLAAVARIDVSAARILEPHLDALEILRQAGAPVPEGATLGVYAAEHPTHRLVVASAALDAAAPGEPVPLSGTKAWCSLAGDLSHAIVTAHVLDAAGEATGRRQALLVDLGQPGVRAGSADAWHALGMQDVPTVDLTIDEGTVGVPIGEPDWYLERSGFAWGGIGVAACWHGGLLGVTELMLSSARLREQSPRGLDQLGLVHLGRAESLRQTAALALASAAARIDAGLAEGAHGAELALLTRRIVARALESVLAESSAALGPAPLAHAAHHAKNVAALEVYVRQEHADRDAAALGRAVLARAGSEGLGA